MKKAFSNKICAAIVVLILAMFCQMNHAHAQGMTRLSKKYHYVSGKTHDQFLPVLLFDTTTEVHIQVWTVFLPAEKKGKISSKKGYYFTFYVKLTDGEKNFDDVYDAFFAYRYESKGDYFSAKGTKVPRTIRNEMLHSGVPKNVVKQLRRDKFRFATEYEAYMQNVLEQKKFEPKSPVTN